MDQLQAIIIGCIILLGTVYASGESNLAVSCESGRVDLQCSQHCCHVNDAEIKAGGFNCRPTVEKELRKLGLVQCCYEKLNPHDIRVTVDSDQKHSRVGQTVTFTYSVLSMQPPFNSTWTHDGSVLSTTDRMKTITNSSTVTLDLCNTFHEVARTEATLTISDVVLEDAGHFSHTFCNRARCVSINFTLHVQGEQLLPPSASIPTSTAATPAVPAAVQTLPPSASIPTSTAATPTVPAGEQTLPPSASIPTSTAATPAVPAGEQTLPPSASIPTSTPAVPAGDEQIQASLAPRIVIGVVVFFLVGIALLARRRETG